MVCNQSKGSTFLGQAAAAPSVLGGPSPLPPSVAQACVKPCCACSLTAMAAMAAVVSEESSAASAHSIRRAGPAAPPAAYHTLGAAHAPRDSHSAAAS
eukprot:scaffold11633_cov33-Phaeocystis_antarctica.AAC.1